MNRTRTACLALFAAAAVAAGCAVGPDYSRPQVEVPEKWRVDVDAAAAVVEPAWWKQMQDPVLDELIETALRENYDIRRAAARVDQFLGALTATRSQFFPQIGYDAAASRNRSSEVGPTAVPSGFDPWYSLYQASLGASWEIDLFGRVRRETEAARADVLASEQGRRAVILSVVTSVASSYIVLRGLDRQLEISKATAANYAGTLRIFELRFKSGVVSRVELEQIRSQFQQAQAAVPNLEEQVAAQENLLSILLGRNPDAIPRGKTMDELATPGIPADLPSSLLERRPDVLEAEQVLVAANAEVGVAKSLYFPSISLTGLLGTASVALGDFLGSGSAVAEAAAGLTGPIFTFGAIRGQVRTAEAARDEAELFYRQVVQNAFREVNDALIGAERKQEEFAAQQARVAALREYARLSRLRFDAGIVSYLELLYAQNELFAAELTAVGTHVERNTRIIDVYEAMGGGWVDEADKYAPKPEGSLAGS